MAVAAPEFPDSTSGTVRDTGGPVTLSVLYTISPGEIELDGEVSGTLEVTTGNVINRLTGSTPQETITVSFSTTGLTQMRNSVNNIGNTVSDLTDLPTEAISSAVRGGIPSDLRSINSEDLMLQASFGSAFGGGVQTVGETPVDFDKSISFPTIAAPDLPAVRAAVDNIPNPEIVIRARQPTTYQGVLQDLRGETPEVRVEIPSWSFFNFVSVDDLDLPCAQGFSDIDSQIDELRSTIERGRNSLESDLETLRGIFAALPVGVGGGAVPEIEITGGRAEVRGEVEEAVSEIQGAELGSIREEIGEARLSNIVDDLESVQPNIVDPQELRGRFQSLRDRIQSNVPDACAPDFLSRLDGVRPQLDAIEEIQPRVQRLTQNLTDLLPAEVELPEGPELRPDLSCSDIPLSLRNRARNFATAGRTFRGGSRATDLASEGEDILGELRSEVDDENPCKQELIGAVREGLRNVRQAGGRRRRGDIREIVPCSEEYSLLSDEVEEFFNDALELSPSASMEEVDSLISKGQELTQRINQNVERGRCAEDFSSTVRSGLNRVDRLQGEVRIISGENVPELPEERQNRLNEIISQLEGLTSELGSNIPEGEVPERLQ